MVSIHRIVFTVFVDCPNKVENIAASDTLLPIILITKSRGINIPIICKVHIMAIK